MVGVLYKPEDGERGEQNQLLKKLRVAVVCIRVVSTDSSRRKARS